jgi:hypothetical protein
VTRDDTGTRYGTSWPALVKQNPYRRFPSPIRNKVVPRKLSARTLCGHSPDGIKDHRCFTGKLANVTGAACGLGRAYAKRFAGLGAKVAVANLNLRSYEEFELEAKDMTGDNTVAESGGTALGIEVDVRDHEAVESIAGRVVQKWGRVDVLVANAGGVRGRPMNECQSERAPTPCVRDEPVRDRLLLQCRRPGHETAVFRQDLHG